MRSPARVVAALCLAAVSLSALTGCFDERSYAMRQRDYVRAPTLPMPMLETAADAPNMFDAAGPDAPYQGTNGVSYPAAHGRTTREWVWRAHAELARLLPRGDTPALLTDDLYDDDGKPVDVLAHFGRNPDHLNSIFRNYFGLVHTARASGAEEAIETPAPPWPDFEDVWIPIHEGLSLSGRLALARGADGEPVEAGCIIVLPGLLGDLAVNRTRDIGRALLDAGHHVLAVELRGFGQTERHYPNVYYNFGVIETGDLLAVSEWLLDMPHVRRTGLIGFCWGANHAMLAGWEDGRAADHPSVSPRLRPYLRPRDGRRHFEAGILAYSPTLAFEEIVEKLDEREFGKLTEPVLYTLQDGVRARMRRKNHPEVSGSLRRLIEYEFTRSGPHYEAVIADGYDYLRFLPHRGRPARDKLESVRVPLLIIHGSNDPLASAQWVADLIAMTKNPNVAAIVLDGGGHVGFAPYCRPYFYSLLLNFFDPHTGPAAFTAQERQAGSRSVLPASSAAQSPH